MNIRSFSGQRITRNGKKKEVKTSIKNGTKKEGKRSIELIEWSLNGDL